MTFVNHEQNGLVYLTSPLLDGVRHGFSTRRGGVSPAPWDTLNLGPGRGDAPENVRENYRRFFGYTGAVPERAVLSLQVHRDDVRLCTAADAGKGLVRERDYEADALITAERDLPLVVFSADCGILLLHDPEAGCVGAVHAGWRGCAAGIVEKTVREMVRLLGARPERILAAVGPCIGKCCFETDSDVPEAMQARRGDTFMEVHIPATPMMVTQASTRLWSLLRLLWMSLLSTTPDTAPMARAVTLNSTGNAICDTVTEPVPELAWTKAAQTLKATRATASSRATT